MESKRKEAKTEAVTPCRERKCYDCTNFYRDHFCGYAACNCKVFGSLDCDQKERHPDTTAATCPEYYVTTK